MPWKSNTTAQSREVFIEKALAEEQSFSALCRAYGITRQTGYKWLSRYQDGASLENRSSRPLHSPRQTPPEVEALLLGERERHPRWGARKLLASLAAQGYTELPAPSTADNILRRNVPKQCPYAIFETFTRFQREHPNALWQADFKKSFPTQDGSFCVPLTVLDDFSRFCLCLDTQTSYGKEAVFQSFTRLFRLHGLPDAILCDNGKPWRTGRRTLSYFEAWLMRLDILPIHGRPHHPQTQGKVERLHRSLKSELLQDTYPKDIPDAQHLLDVWREEYNAVRPHYALDYNTPASRYRDSPKPFPETLPPIRQTPGAENRQVSSQGYLYYDGHSFFLGEALSGLPVSILPTDEERFCRLVFNSFSFALLDLLELRPIPQRFEYVPLAIGY